METDEIHKRWVIDQFNQTQMQQMLMWEFKKHVSPKMHRYVTIHGSRIALKVPHRKMLTFVADVETFNISSILIEKQQTIIVFTKKK